MNQDLVKVIQEEIAQSRADGLEGDDLVWMAQGAALRYGREQGIIGENVDPAMHAAIAEVVKQELKQ